MPPALPVPLHDFATTLQLARPLFRQDYPQIAFRRE
jgi:hypothetical protein